jgi:altronate dehydratase small subunit
MTTDDPPTPTPTPTPTLLLLADGDDVLIATGDLEPGLHRSSTGAQLTVTEPIRLGHKVAARPIAVGDLVLRCGVPIGSATGDIAPGAWVHTHNLVSNYVATFAHRGGQL